MPESARMDELGDLEFARAQRAAKLSKGREISALTPSASPPDPVVWRKSGLKGLTERCAGAGIELRARARSCEQRLIVDKLCLELREGRERRFLIRPDDEVLIEPLTTMTEHPLDDELRRIGREADRIDDRTEGELHRAPITGL